VRWRRRLARRSDESRLAWWIAVLFMVGALLFAVGSFPPYAQLVDPGAVGATFFVGSIFFTLAAGGQLLQAERDERAGATAGPVRWFGRGLDWWAAIVQFAGTVLFNVSTYDALRDGLSTRQTNRLVWAPDMLGSTAFLVAGWFGWVAVCRCAWDVLRDEVEWWIAALNGAGAVVFMVSAVASLTLPASGQVLDLTLVNTGTFLGAVCFLVGAYLLLPPASSDPALSATRTSPGRSRPG
jgi:hypothetical protein